MLYYRFLRAAAVPARIYC